MLRGLEGRRIAVYASGSDRTEIQKELIAAGAVLSELPGAGDEQSWHGGKYAGLVVLGPEVSRGDLQKLKQLLREFLVSEKPVATFEADAEALELDESLVAVRGSGDPRAFATEVVREFAERLHEHDVDEMSEQSFPASDPPAVNPGTAGPVSPGPERHA